MPGEFAFDGHAQIRGVWGGNPTSVPNVYAQSAVNRFFRNDYNNTRPSIQNITLTFESAEQQAFFEAANGQGATFYNTYPSYITPRLVASLGGRIYTIEIQGRNGYVRQLFDGNSRQFMHAWFAQGFQWLVIQDGISPPVLWDGENPARRSDLIKNEVPIGSVMAFIYGRFVVASADGKNSLYVGDIAYGDTVTNPNNILNFTERTYWAEGGNFDTPTFLGNIMGMYVMPFIDTAGAAQNELVIGCQGGFASLDISGPRTTWLDNQVMRVALIGSGLASSHGYSGLNGDMFYRSLDGVSSYRNARVEFAQRWNQTPISREVNYWLQPDRKDLLEFVPQVSWQNMVFTGCSPLWEQPNTQDFGYHRYCRGMVILDADSMSTTGRDGAPVWHGMWSGVRPWAFAKGIIQNQERCFVFSFDRDGRNRLYEMTLTLDNDVFETQPKKVTSFYLTGEFGTVEARTNAFAPKIFNGGVIEYSGLTGESHFNVQYRPDGSPCWVDVKQGDTGCDCPGREGECPNPYAAPQWGRAYFPKVDKGCVPGSTQPANVFHHCQVRVNMNGPFTVNRLNIRMDLQTDAQTAKCITPDCNPIDCCAAADDYAYHIAPAGTNTNVPVVPPIPGTIFTATRTAQAVCAGFPSISVIAQGQATSTISQADADQKAQTAAQANAHAQLVCPQCNPSVEADFFISGGETQDLSAYFVSGLYDGSQNQPWRLYDVILDQYISSGIVNDSGTLQWLANYPQYTHGSFNETTNVYSDAGPGSTRIELQIGCSFNGQQFWPTPSSYGM